MTDPAAPLAMQLAARVEKVDPPTVTDLCVAAAKATVALLADPRSRPGGPWHAAVAAWNGARIRKLVRRGRGAGWTRAQEPDGVTVCHGGAEVRAYVPCPMDEVPEPVAKLQIQSTPIEGADRTEHPEQASGLVIAVTPTPEMSWGKQAAQCAHAAQRAWMEAPPDIVERWEQSGCPISVVHPTPRAWEALGDRATTRIHDGGFTEIPAGTLTTLAWWQEPFEPAPPDLELVPEAGSATGRGSDDGDTDMEDPMQEWLHTTDGVTRCWWPGEDDLYVAYHDEEWGMPVVDDNRLFEKICLEGFQSGLAWITILRKRENFREAFAGFDIETVAAFDERDVERLLGDPGIVRHRGKIESTVNNARRAIELAADQGSLARYFWSFEPQSREVEPEGDLPIPSTTPTSTRLGRDLKKRGWTWVGPTTVYAFMQAMGLVNDHVTGCDARLRVEDARANLRRP